ncbi:MAG: hypothetical protein JO168_22795 [Solirubrobacterales bacterium]|nr:hypothetical protein [Solirubrobacterales bacterium]MBV9717415.1 hypothetical protein [Solirubrobacterales bacterium]
MAEPAANPCGRSYAALSVCLRTALWLAVGLGGVTLAGRGLRFARLEQLSGTGRIATVAIDLMSVIAVLEALLHVRVVLLMLFTRCRIASR